MSHSDAPIGASQVPPSSADLSSHSGVEEVAKLVSEIVDALAWRRVATLKEVAQGNVPALAIKGGP